MLQLKSLLIILFSALLVASTTFWGTADDDDEEIPLSDVPARVLEAANKAVPGGEVKEVEKELRDGVVIYEVEKLVDGTEYEIEVTADGVVKEIEQEAADEEYQHREKYGCHQWD